MACSFCYRSGEIGFREDAADVPKGSIIFAYDEMEALKNTCSIHASYDGRTIFVPDISEAETHESAYEAFQDWCDWAFPNQPAFVGPWS